MKFEWNERKNEVNIDKHGFDFYDTYRIFDLPMAVEIDQRDDYDEDRWIGTGLLDGRVVIVIYTEPDRDTVRIISLRKALSYERRNYEQYLKNGLG
jgi:uncharacterized protein